MFIIKILTILVLFTVNSTAHMCASHDSSNEHESYIDNTIDYESSDDDIENLSENSEYESSTEEIHDDNDEENS